MFLYLDRSKWNSVEKETLHGRTERRFTMKYFRFSRADSNYTMLNNEHIWDLPLSLRHRKVGLSSIVVLLKPEYEDATHLVEFVYVKCNLIDRTMENQQGILDIVPLNIEKFTASAKSTLIGGFTM